MVVEDTEVLPLPPVEKLPYFCCFVKHDEIKGQPYALQMNAWILRILAGLDKTEHPIYSSDDYYDTSGFTPGFPEWAVHCQRFISKHFPKLKPTLAGKNVAAFDLQFFPDELKKLFNHRFIDPGSLYLSWDESGPPSLDTLLKEYEIKSEAQHDALEDARDVIRLLRKSYKDR